MHVGVVFVAIYLIHLFPSNSKWALSPEGHFKQLELFTQPDNTVQVIIHLHVCSHPVCVMVCMYNLHESASQVLTVTSFFQLLVEEGVC